MEVENKETGEEPKAEETPKIEDPKPEESPTPTEAPKPPEKPIKKKGHRTMVWLIIIFLIVALSGLAYGAYSGGYLDEMLGIKKETSNESKTAETKTDKTETVETASTVAKVTDAGVTWIKPEKLADLGLFEKVASYEGMGEYSGTTYYKVGTTSVGSEIIDAIVLGIDRDFHRFLKRDGIYYRVKQNSADLDYQMYTPTKSVIEDTTTLFKSLLPDKTITSGETDMIFQLQGGVEKDESFSVGQKVSTTKWGDLYLEKGSDISADKTGIGFIARYYVLLADSSRAIYSPKPVFLRDDNTFGITWSAAAGKTISFEKVRTSGCGSGAGSFPMAFDKTGLATKEEAGKSTASSKVYHFTAATNSINTFGYEVYKLDGATGKDPIATYITNLGVVVWYDDFDTPIIYSNTKYVPAVECGKPVIYLYPEKPTVVSVKVGASITKSDPVYQNGWQALADPSGMLTVAGRQYDSLFWEGTGVGEYPQIASGKIVASGQAVREIRSDLSYMGLNGKEISDFLTFWQPKLPTTPYTRLTWLQTKDMDKLAPLAVSPKPATSIRVFLDFAGLDKKIDLPAQNLIPMQRFGYTLVEWGGLLRNAD